MPAALKCPAGHSFDLAKQGYVTLTGSDARGAAGDTAAMVAARAEFLSSGHYAPLTDALVNASLSAPPGPVLDLGAGTGHHLAALLDAAPGRVGVALDRSRYAARRAARSHPRTGAVVADTWRALPLQSGSTALVVCIFAPRNGSEIARVLAPDGILVVVTPESDHLAELIAPLGMLQVDERKDQRLAQSLEPFLYAAGRTERRWLMRLYGADVTALAAMGPSAHHLELNMLADRVNRLGSTVKVTAHVKVSTYRNAG